MLCPSHSLMSKVSSCCLSPFCTIEDPPSGKIWFECEKCGKECEVVEDGVPSEEEIETMQILLNAIEAGEVGSLGTEIRKPFCRYIRFLQSRLSQLETENIRLKALWESKHGPDDACAVYYRKIWQENVELQSRISQFEQRKAFLPESLNEMTEYDRRIAETMYEVMQDKIEKLESEKRRMQERKCTKCGKQMWPTFICSDCISGISPLSQQ